MGEPRTIIQCNYKCGISPVAEGAKAYLSRTNPGGGNDRIVILVRSRGGRWICKWESTQNLRDFRVRNLPYMHPMYGDERVMDNCNQKLADMLNEVSSGRSEAGQDRDPV